jgi:hypothetical protein
MSSAPATELQVNVRSDGSGITGFCFAMHLEPVGMFVCSARRYPKRYVKRRILRPHGHVFSTNRPIQQMPRQCPPRTKAAETGVLSRRPVTFICQRRCYLGIGDDAMHRWFSNRVHNLRGGNDFQARQR